MIQPRPSLLAEEERGRVAEEGAGPDERRSSAARWSRPGRRSRRRSLRPSRPARSARRRRRSRGTRAPSRADRSTARASSRRRRGSPGDGSPGRSACRGSRRRPRRAIAPASFALPLLSCGRCIGLSPRRPEPCRRRRQRARHDRIRVAQRQGGGAGVGLGDVGEEADRGRPRAGHERMLGARLAQRRQRRPDLRPQRDRRLAEVVDEQPRVVERRRPSPAAASSCSRSATSSSAGRGSPSRSASLKTSGVRRPASSGISTARPLAAHRQRRQPLPRPLDEHGLRLQLRGHVGAERGRDPLEPVDLAGREPQHRRGVGAAAAEAGSDRDPLLDLDPQRRRLPARLAQRRQRRRRQVRAGDALADHLVGAVPAARARPGSCRSASAARRSSRARAGRPRERARGRGRG